MYQHIFTREVPFPGRTLKVTFTGEMLQENHSHRPGEGEDWCCGETAWQMEEVSWEYESYTEEENSAICEYVWSEWETLEEAESLSFERSFDPPSPDLQMQDTSDSTENLEP